VIIEYPKDIKTKIAEELPFWEGRRRGYLALWTLETKPELANDPEIRKALFQILHNDYGIAYSYAAANILCEINDPEGINHLVYYSMAVHPVLKKQLSKISGWSSSRLLPRLDLITEEHFELLLEDMIASKYGCHIDLFAALPDEMVLQRMLDLLAHPAEHVSFVAAAVLAMKGVDVGREILIKRSANLCFSRRSMIALSHIANDKVISLLRDFSKGNTTVCEEHPNFVLILRSVAVQRLAIIEAIQSDDPYAFYTMVKRWFKFPLQGIFNSSAPITMQSNTQLYVRSIGARPLCLPDDLVVPTWMPDILFEFSSDNDRKQIYQEQKNQVSQLMHEMDDPFLILKDGFTSLILRHSFFAGLPFLGAPSIPHYLPGVKFVYEPTDYLKYSTDWILHPEKYLYGSCHRI